MGCAIARKQIHIKSNILTQSSIKSKLNLSCDPEFIRINSSSCVLSAKDPLKYYDLLELIGTGSYGQVYKAKKKSTNEFFSMKIISKAKKDSSLNELLNEISVLKNLDHPHIIKIFEYFETKDKIFIVNELCEKGDLQKYIEKEKIIKEKIVKKIIKQLIMILNYLHKNRIIHRDLKLQNILIEDSTDDNFSIKLIDFGISTEIKGYNLTESIGTVLYVAPEVILSDYNEKCDIWSIGIIMFYLLSGKLPFAGINQKEIMQKVIVGELKFEDAIWNTVSENAKNLIKNLLNKDYSIRINAEQALDNVWFKNENDLSSSNFNSEKLTFCEEENSNNDEKIRLAFKNIKDFKVKSSIEQLAQIFVTRNLLNKERYSEFINIFKIFDTNNDGKISFEELNFHFRNFSNGSNTDFDNFDLEEAFKKIDFNKNGYIEYSEFLVAVLKNIYTPNNLQEVFQLFDTENKGKISTNDLKVVLSPLKGPRLSNYFWKKLLSEVDTNSDGFISFNEFKNHLIDNIEDGFEI